jgi:hypothetical protein
MSKPQIRCEIKDTVTRIFILLHEAYGGDVLSRRDVPKWHKRFSQEREDVEDEQPDCLGTMRTDENVEKERTLVRTGCCLGMRIQVAHN